MNVSQPIQGVPPGLEYLTMIDRIVVHQLIELREIVLNYQTRNKYVLLNANGEQVYYAFEESSLCMRCWCDMHRSFTMHIVDNFGKEVLRVTRPFKCCGGGCYGCFACIDCCTYECSVEAPPGNVIGSVVQRQACCASSFDVKNEGDQIILSIDGPFIACGRNVEFPIRTPSGASVGDITKKWRGLLRELVTNADTFSVS
ncbi:Phospholipid scramblase, partial [Trichostrongylus colubriformis]